VIPNSYRWSAIFRCAVSFGLIACMAACGGGGGGGSSPTPAPSAAVSSAGKQWQVASHSKGDMTDVQFLNGKFFAVNTFGVILVSTNGLDWAAKSTPFGNLHAITYGDSGYVAVGVGNTVLKSSDGESWTRTTPVEEPGTGNSNITFYGVAAGKGGYVATGIGGIFHSVDAVTWTNVSPTGVTNMSRVAFGSGRFVAVGYNAKVYGSDDGIAWTPVNIPGVFSGLDVVYGNGRFVLTPGGSDILTSADGILWQTMANGVIVRALRFGNGQYFLIADNSVMASPDAITWTTVYSKIDAAQAPIAMAASADRYVVVGFNGLLQQSTDTRTWTSVAQGPSVQLTGVDAMNGTWVAVGDGAGGKILKSIDALSWTPASTVIPHLRSITHGNGQFVAVGAGKIVLSADGDQWTSANVNTTTEFFSVTYGNGRFVTVGLRGNVLTSTNGTNWSAPDSGVTCNLLGVTYGNGRFVAVGAQGEIRDSNGWVIVRAQTVILSSTDGLTWTQGPATSSWFNAVTFGNGRFVAVADSGVIWTSADGQTWATSPSGTSNDLLGVSYGNQQFVAVGGWGTVLVSENGTHWQPRTSGVNSYLYGIAFNGNSFVAVGSGGTIVLSTP
jgi:hypothetical protein